MKESQTQSNKITSIAGVTTAAAMNPTSNGLFLVNPAPQEFETCSQKALLNPCCLACMQMQRKLVMWGVSEKLLRRALCGRWELIRFVEKQRYI
jgi:hypothetical protein